MSAPKLKPWRNWRNSYALRMARRDREGMIARAMYRVRLESVLRHFLEQHGCTEAGAALERAMNDAPADGEIAARNAKVARFLSNTAGSAS